MEEAGIRELKTHLSAFLRKVKAGEMVTITDRGKPIGRIMPIASSTHEKLDAMVEAGIAEWSGNRYSPSKPTARMKGDRALSDLLLEDRR